MAFRPIFILPGGERGKNGQVFATEAEALASAGARFMVWTMPTGFEAEACDDAVTFRWDAERGDVMLDVPAAA